MKIKSSDESGSPQITQINTELLILNINEINQNLCQSV